MSSWRSFPLAVLLTLVTAAGLTRSSAQPLLSRQAGLLARVGNELKPLEILRADVQVEIAGGHAVTTTTFVFRNPFDLELEGDMVFPLPAGATVCGFGLDIAGAIVDATAVERQMARAAYGVQVRQSVDPALLEWVRGDVFRTRVFPIAARGQRSVRIRHLSPLVGGSGRTPMAVLQMPTAHLKAAAEVALQVEVVGDGPVSESSGLLRFERQGERLVARMNRSGQGLPDELNVALPVAASAMSVTGGGPDDKTYFSIDDYVTPAGLPAGAPVPRVGLAWDASLSRAGEDTAREIRLIEQWASQAGSVDVDLAVLRDVAEPVRRFAVRGHDASRLVRALRGITYDGGTRLDLVPACSGCDYQMLFTDGQSMFDEWLPPADAAPLDVVITGRSPETVRLEGIAQATGGSCLDLATTKDGDILARLGRRRFSLLRVRAETGRISDVQIGDADASSGRASVSGRLLTPSARVVLEYGRQRRIVARHAVAVRGPGESALPALVWAHRTSARLSLQPEKNRAALLRLGGSFNLATPATSLLVLETARQYLASGLEPPRSRAALYAEYQRRREDWEAWRRHSDQCHEQRVRRDVVAGWQDHLREARGIQEESNDVAERPVTLGNGTASVAGTVRDYAGGIMPGIDVQIKDLCTGATRTVTAGEDGRYEAPGLPEGNYTVVAVLSGLWCDPRETPLRPGHQATIDLNMEIAGLYERVVRSDYGSVVVASERDEERSDAAAELREWDPAATYVQTIAKAAPGRRYAAYLAERAKYAQSPSFYLDAANVFLQRGDRILARRLLTNVVELDPGDVHLLRAAAHRLQAAGELDLAVRLFEKVRLQLRADVQARLDLARALAERAERRRAKTGRIDDVALVDYRRAMRLDREIVDGHRAGEDWLGTGEVLALSDLSGMLALFRRHRITPDPEFQIDPRLVEPLDADLRVLLTWDDDRADLYLIVDEPGGTGSSRYFDPGTGSVHVQNSNFRAEEYLVVKAAKGPYEIRVGYNGDLPSLLGPTTARATIITDFGRPTQRSKQVSVRLVNERERYLLATVPR